MAFNWKNINKRYEELPNWIATPSFYIILIIVPIIVALILSFLFWKLYWFFIFLFLFVPSLTYGLRKKYNTEPITVDKAIKIKKTLRIISVIVFLTFLLNYNAIRNYLSEKILPGYSVEYYGGEDRYGAPITEISISTNHWYWTIAAYALAVLLFILLLLMIYIVFQQSEKIVERVRVANSKEFKN